MVSLSYNECAPQFHRIDIIAWNLQLLISAMCPLYINIIYQYYIYIFFAHFKILSFHLP